MATCGVSGSPGSSWSSGSPGSSGASGYTRFASSFDTDRVHWTTDVEFNDGDPVHQARRGTAARLDPADIVDSKDFKTLTADVDSLLAKKDLSASDRTALGKVQDFLNWFEQQFGQDSGDIDCGNNSCGAAGGPSGGTAGKGNGTTAEVSSLMQKMFSPFGNLFSAAAPAPSPSPGDIVDGGHHGPSPSPSPSPSQSPSGVPNHLPSSSGGSQAGGLSAAALAANPALQPYAAAIARASKASGIAPEIIGAQIWAESRGNMSQKTQNGDGSFDYGLMQIGEQRLSKDNLDKAQKDAIEAATGKSFDQLDVHDPADNIMAGAFHLKYFIGQNGGDINAGLAAYVGRDPLYVNNIHTFLDQLKAGKALTQDAGTPF